MFIWKICVVRGFSRRLCLTIQTGRICLLPRDEQWNINSLWLKLELIWTAKDCWSCLFFKIVKEKHKRYQRARALSRWRRKKLVSLRWIKRRCDHASESKKKIKGDRSEVCASLSDVKRVLRLSSEVATGTGGALSLSNEWMNQRGFPLGSCDWVDMVVTS